MNVSVEIKLLQSDSRSLRSNSLQSAVSPSKINLADPMHTDAHGLLLRDNDFILSFVPAKDLPFGDYSAIRMPNAILIFLYF